MATQRRAPKARPRPHTTTQGQARVTSELTHRRSKLSSEVQDEDLDKVPFPPGVEPAYVRVALGKTYNMGDFNSLRIDVSVTLPCLPEDIHETHQEATDFCTEKLAEEESLWFAEQPRR